MGGVTFVLLISCAPLAKEPWWSDLGGLPELEEAERPLLTERASYGAEDAPEEELHQTQQALEGTSCELTSTRSEMAANGRRYQQERAAAADELAATNAEARPTPSLHPEEEGLARGLAEGGAPGAYGLRR